MEQLNLRKEAEVFEADRRLKQRKRFFKKLEDQGLIVSVERSAYFYWSFQSTNLIMIRFESNIFWLRIQVVVTVALITVALIMGCVALSMLPRFYGSF